MQTGKRGARPQRPFSKRHSAATRYVCKDSHGFSKKKMNQDFVYLLRPGNTESFRTAGIQKHTAEQGQHKYDAKIE